MTTDPVLDPILDYLRSHENPVARRIAVAIEQWPNKSPEDRAIERKMILKDWNEFYQLPRVVAASETKLLEA